MFSYFWNDLSFLWSEDTFENLFKLLAKRGLSDYVQALFRSRTTVTIFEAMSYQYKFLFIDHILQIKHDLIEEFNELAMNSN